MIFNEDIVQWMEAIRADMKKGVTSIRTLQAQGELYTTENRDALIDSIKRLCGPIEELDVSEYDGSDSA
jgi:hypothetical protein